MTNVKKGDVFTILNLFLLFLVLIIVTLFVISVYLGNEAENFKAANDKFLYYTISDLLRYIAIMIGSVALGIKSIQLLKKGDSKIIVFILLAISLAGFILPINVMTVAIRDLNSNVPIQKEGIVITKDYMILGRGAKEYYIYLDNDDDYFVMKGDLSSNGYEKVNKGDKVRVWHGTYSRKTYLIEVLNSDTQT